MTNRQSAGKSFAYLLGVYLGDGCVTHVQGYDRFRLNTIDEDFAQATSAAVEDITGRRYPVNGPYQDKRFSQSRPQYQFYCGNTDLCDRLKHQTGEKQKIPEWVFTADKDLRLAFIAGLMDSEGFVAENKNWTNRRFYMGFKSCDAWVLDFVRLLEETGIRTGQVYTEEPRKAHYKRPTAFRIKMQSWVDSGAYFNCSRKQRRVDEWASVGPYVQRDAKAILNEHTSNTVR
jgi:intein-encoded DNA endonuclease-like protein